MSMDRPLSVAEQRLAKRQSQQELLLLPNGESKSSVKSKSKRKNRSGSSRGSQSDSELENVSSIDLASFQAKSKQAQSDDEEDVQKNEQSKVPPMLAQGTAMGSSRVLSFDSLQQARQNSSGVLLGNMRKPLTIEFDRLDYFVTLPVTGFLSSLKPHIKPPTRQILYNVNGAAFPGEMVAVMGPSGGGKTTLLNLLAGRVAGEYVGNVTIDGKPPSKALRQYMAFVLQDDILFTHLTVRETLTFTGLLRLPREMSYSDKLKQIEYVIDVLGLKKCAETKIGNVFSRGISGGERKRTSIALELLTNPSILFLDEPTSGLDATMALNLINTLKSLARNENRTVLCSIHQPSSQIFESFDKLILLADGHLIYNGKVSEAVSYFSKLQFKCPRHYNPADYFMGLLVDNDASKKKLIEAYENSGTQKEKPPTKLLSASMMGTEENGSVHKWEATWTQQFMILSQRGMKSTWGDLMSTLNIVQSLVISIVCGLLWFQIPITEAGAFDRSGLIFFTSIYWSFTPLFLGIVSFPAERAVFNKERQARSYRLSAWFLAKTATELAVISLMPLFSILIIYFMAGLQYTFQNWISFTLTIILTTWVFHSLSIFVGVIVHDFQQSITLAATFMLSTMLLGGYYIKNVPFWLTWAKYLSISNYSYAVLMGIDFNNNLDFACAVEDSAFSECASSDTFPAPDFLIEQGIDTRIGLDIGCLVIFFVGFRILAYSVLRFRKS